MKKTVAPRAKFSISILFLLILLLCTQPLFALVSLTDEEIAYINARGPVLTASADGSGPIQYRDSKGNVQGIAFRVLEEISRRTGLTFSYNLYTDPYDLQNAYTNGTEILFGIPDQYIRSGYPVSAPFLQSQTILFANKSIKPQDLEGKRFATPRTATPPAGIPEELIVYTNSREESIMAVDKGEADYGYGNAYSIAFYTLQRGFKNIYTVPQGHEERSYRILYVADDPLLISIVEKGFSSLTKRDLQSIILAATSQVERLITPSMIMDTYGYAVMFIALLAISILVATLTIIQKSRNRLDLERKKLHTISEVSNEYLFEFNVYHKTLILYDKFKSLFTTEESLHMNKDLLMQHLIALTPSEEGPIINLDIPNGPKGYFKIITSKVPGEKAPGETWIGKLKDVSEEVAKQNHLKALAQTDGLTGLLNATTTRQHIESHLAQRDPSQQDYFILFDLDDFKRVNDTMGHLAGNTVLETLGTILLQGSRPDNDIIGRVGGDEFGIYLNSVPSHTDALTYCTSLLETVRFRFNDYGVTISIGMAKVEHGENYQELYTRVDLALYQAKGRGKNRIEYVGNL